MPIFGTFRRWVITVGHLGTGDLRIDTNIAKIR